MMPSTWQRVWDTALANGWDIKDPWWLISVDR